MQRARESLLGLSVGDAFGEQFFFAPDLMATRELPPPPWHYTDDSAMAASIVEVLQEWGPIEQDRLAERFAARFTSEPNRGYGAMAHHILQRIAEGAEWRDVSRAAFGGEGSLGNGAAMRAAPIGAYFADDYKAVADNACRSAEITHAHPDGQAGAIAVAVAAAFASRVGSSRHPASGINRDTFEEMIETTLQHTPEGPIHDGLTQALRLPLETDVGTAASVLGNGSQIIASDTVPFCVWSAARHLDSYVEALWATVSALGDRDTTCAIVGGIVASAAGQDAIPVEWKHSAERLS